MEFCIEKWLEEITEKIKKHFNHRVIFIGYHGSYKRKEASPDSDIDMVVILDNLNIEDLKTYKAIVQSMPFCEKACGFIAGKKEIVNWSKPDLFQFKYETEVLYGDINEIMPSLSTDDIKYAVKSSAEVLYHTACHSFIYDKNLPESLSSLYKMTFFIQQAEYFVNHQEYIPCKKELAELLCDDEKFIIETSINREMIKKMSEKEIENLYAKLLNWCIEKVCP